MLDKKGYMFNEPQGQLLVNFPMENFFKTLKVKPCTVTGLKPELRPGSLHLKVA